MKLSQHGIDDAAINDFHRIWYGNRLRMTTDFMLELHEEARAFLEKEVRPGDVVITHWPPTLKAAHPWARYDPRAEDIACALGSLAVEAREIRGHPDGGLSGRNPPLRPESGVFVARPPYACGYIAGYTD